MKVKETTRPQKSRWITRGILVSRDRLKFLHSIFIRSNNDDFKTFYKSYKRIYRKVIKAAKAYDISKTLKEAEHFSKTAWNIINNLTKKTPHFSKNSNIKLEVNNKTVEQPKDVANEFNSFFSSVATSYLSFKPFEPSGGEP